MAAARTLLFQVTAAVVLLAAAGYFVAPSAIATVFGEEFLPAAPLFRILLWGV